MNTMEFTALMRSDHNARARWIANVETADVSCRRVVVGWGGIDAVVDFVVDGTNLDSLAGFLFVAAGDVGFRVTPQTLATFNHASESLWASCKKGGPRWLAASNRNIGLRWLAISCALSCESPLETGADWTACTDWSGCIVSRNYSRHSWNLVAGVA